MVDKVKCGNKDCKLFDVVVPVSNLHQQDRSARRAMAVS
jgi:hypothetical protein